MGMTRLDFVNGMTADLHTWYWEGGETFYKSYQKQYTDLADVRSIKEIKGAFYKTTSAVGAQELDDLDEYGVAKQDRPMDGYSVYALKKAKAIVIDVPRLISRDWHRTADFLKSYMKENGTKMVENTKEKIVSNLYLQAGVTAGHAVFNQDSGDANLTTGYTSFIYDGKPWAVLTGNNHTAKDANTYFNAVALSTTSPSGQANGVTYANALTMWNRLTVTNAKMENGRPFDIEQMGISIVCNKSAKPDWEVVNNSTLNPDNAENAINPLKGMFKKIVGSPYITTPTQSVMYVKDGLVVFFSEPQFEFWETKNPNVFHAQIILDYAIFVKNFRLAVFNNASVTAV